MSGTARPLDSGRKDSLGRTVKVAADAGESRADAPPPGGVNQVLRDLLYDKLVAEHDDEHGDGEGRVKADEILEELFATGKVTDEMLGELIGERNPRGACRAVIGDVPLDVFNEHRQVEHLVAIYQAGDGDRFVASGLSPFQFVQAGEHGLSDDELAKVAGFDWQQRSTYFKQRGSGFDHSDAATMVEARLSPRHLAMMESAGLDLSSVLTAQAAGKLSKITDTWAAARFDDEDAPEFVNAVVEEVMARTRYFHSEKRDRSIISTYTAARRQGMTADEFDELRRDAPSSFGEIAERHLKTYMDAREFGMEPRFAAMFTYQTRTSMNQLRRYRVTSDDISDLVAVDGFGPEHFGKYTYWRNNERAQSTGTGASRRTVSAGPNKTHREAKMFVEIDIAEGRAAEMVRARYAAEDEAAAAAKDGG